MIAQGTARIRIVCKDPAVGDGGNRLIPSLADTVVYAVTKDGGEVELEGVERVEWVADGAKPARAVVVFAGAKADIESHEGCLYVVGKRKDGGA